MTTALLALPCAGHYYTRHITTGKWTCLTCGTIDDTRSGLSATRRKPAAS